MIHLELIYHQIDNNSLFLGTGPYTFTTNALTIASTLLGDIGVSFRGAF